MNAILRERQLTHRPDLRDHPTMKSQRPPPIGMESSVYQYDGTNIFQWHVREAVYWNPYGDMMVIDE